MKLLASPNSPFGRKVRVVLIEKGLHFELENTDIWRSPDIEKFNPIGKIPCLIAEDGESIFDSRVIVQYVEMLCCRVRLVPDGGIERIRVLRWEALADGLLDALTSARMELTYAGRSDLERSQSWIDRQMAKAHAILFNMESRLDAREWCVGAQLSLADLVCANSLAYLDLRFADMNWRDHHPALVRLHAQVASRESFLQTQPVI